MKQYINISNCAAVACGFNSEFVVLLTSEDTSYIVPKNEYKNKGEYTGYAEYISEGRHIFDLLGGSYKLHNIISGVIDWECRREWLACFTEAQINEALNIEKMFSPKTEKIDTLRIIRLIQKYESVLYWDNVNGSDVSEDLKECHEIINILKHINQL